MSPSGQQFEIIKDTWYKTKIIADGSNIKVVFGRDVENGPVQIVSVDDFSLTNGKIGFGGSCDESGVHNHFDDVKVYKVGDTWTWNGKDDLGNLVSDGIYTYKIDATDFAGNPAVQQTGTITLDATYPDSVVTAPVDGTSYSTLPAIFGTAFDETSGLSDVQISIQNITGNTFWDGTVSNWVPTETWINMGALADWSYTAPAWSDGSNYRVRAKTVDNAGNVETPSSGNRFAFILSPDADSPVVNVLFPEEGDYFLAENPVINIAGVLDDAHLKSYVIEYSAGAAPLSWTKIYRSSGIPLNAATYDELVGIEGVGPATAQEIINARPFYNWQDVLDVKYVGIVRLKSIQNSCILPVSQEGLIYQWDTTDVPKGNYTIRITGEDMSGNSTEMEVNINIKTLPPAISTGEVVINEIAWSGTKGGGWSDEWIELFNNTSSTIYLTGCSLYDSDGKMDIDFIGNIPPGEYLTGYFLIENDEECTTEPSDIADPSVSLNNTGEQLILYDCHGNLIDTANGTGAWFAGDNTDFHRTMERRNPTFPGTIARNWASNDGLTKNGTDKSGYALYGTPKAENSVYDVTPPEAVTTLTATAKAAGDIELSWLEPFDNLSGVYEYKIFRSTYPGTGSEITLSTNTLYTDSGANLEDKVRYYYTVQPVDVPGNVQTVDNNQSSAVCDKIPPVFTVICSPVKAKTNDVVTIKVFSNETLITDPGVTALDNFSNSIFLSGPVVSTNTWTYTTVIDTTMAEGAAIVNVSGTDLVGNQGAGQGWLNIDNIPDIQNVSDSPDPCRTAVELSTVTYELTTDAAVSINLLDANNNIVRHLVSELSELTGVRSHAWDGKDDSGNWLPNGIYTYQIKTNVGGSITTDESAEVTISNVLVVITVPVFYVDGVANNVFSPDDDGLADTIDIVYSLSEEAGVSVIISDKVTGEIVRNLITDETRAVGISTDTWDGKRDSGFYVPNASYNIKIIAETYGNPVESAPGLVIVKSKDILVFSDIADSPDPFSPDGDFVDEVSTITYSLSDLKGATSSYVSIKIYSDSGGENLVRDLISNSEEAVPGIYSHTWDGKREDGKFVSNGKYYYQLTGTDQFGYTTEVGPSQQYIITMQVDVLTISVEPVNPATFSPDGDGTDDITTLSYMFSDTKTTEPVKVSVKVYSDQEGTSITRCLLSDTTQALDVLQNVVWDGKDDNRGLVSPGDYYYQVTAFDVLGYSCESSMNKVTISNTALYVYNISTEPDPFSPNFDGVRDTITIHYSISKNSNVTIRIEDKDNPDIFRILIDDELRQSGQNPQSADWGGRDYNGDIVSDGIYLLNIQAKTAQKTSPVESSYIVVASESPNETMSSDGFVDIWYPNIAGAVSISTTSVPDNASKSLQLSGLEIMGELYDISPDGVIFTPAAFLIMFYEPALLPEGGSEEELDIYDWNEELGEWVALGGTVDRINHRVIVRVGSVASLYAVLSPVSTMFDTTPPEFGVVLTVDPETSDEMIITVTASEELQAAPDIIAEVLPNGNSKKDKKQSVEIEMEPVTGTTTTYKGIYTKRTGFGDIDKIYVTGKDLAGNEGVSDGSFVREVVSSVKVSRAGPDMTFRKGEIYSYPNPAKRGKKPTIHVECGIADKVQIKIYNIAGELVYTKELSGNEFTIVRGKYAYEHAWNISDIASGVYLYSVKALKEGEGDITEVKKLAVIK
ncbi:MAG: FlgD immunoglobulin-like domain containing protein [bacterium]